MSQSRPDSTALAEILCRTSNCVCRLISTIELGECPPVAKSASSGKSSLEQVRITHADLGFSSGTVTDRLSAIAQAFPLLLIGLDKLELMPEGSSVKGQITWSLVKIFEEILERICDLSAAHTQGIQTVTAKNCADSAQALQESVATSDSFPVAKKLRETCQPCRQRHRKCSGGKPRCQNCVKANRVCKKGVPVEFAATTITKGLSKPPTESILRFCEFAIMLVGHLDTSKTTHEEVMEGFLFFLLQKLGQQLKSYTVGTQADWGAEDTDAQGKTRSKNDCEFTEAQAQCLIWIYEQVQTYTKPAQTKSCSKVTDLSSASSRTSLSIIEQHRFQNTMLKAVFGDKVTRDYRPVLTPPSSPLNDGFFDRLAGDLSETQIGMNDWFKREIWRVVGWDVLRGKLKWERD